MIRSSHLTTRCNVDQCHREVFSEHPACVLHCDKTEYIGDSFSEMLPSFYDELIDYISDAICSRQTLVEVQGYDQETIQRCFRGQLEYTHTTKNVVNQLKTEFIRFREVYFPDRTGSYGNDYLDILKMLGQIHFNYCKFSATRLDLEEVGVFYQDCVFYQRWTISKTEMLSNENSVIYQMCVFNEDVNSYTDDFGQGKLFHPLFNDCIFVEKLELHNLTADSPIFKNTKDWDHRCKSLEILNSTFQSNFSINNTNFNFVSIKDSVFNKKFEFKENSVTRFEINNSNFKGLFDAYKTCFLSFESFKSIFEDFSGFERCEFGVHDDRDKAYLAQFTYVTFLDFTNFRNAKFNSGLDLENTNLKAPPNFLNAEVNLPTTNRETFRIIKNSFDKIGNHIEANKFFVLEMKKHKEGLNGTPLTQEKIVFYANSWLSSFGNSYKKPIIWMALITLSYYLLMLGYENNTLYKIVPSCNKIISAIAYFFNELASSILPFKRFLTEGMEFVSLIFYIIYAILIWQIIVAVKRHTKR